MAGRSADQGAAGAAQRNCLLSHDPKIDDPGLIAALRSNCFYIGALGSKKTQAARNARMKREGFGDNEIARIHGPVGSMEPADAYTITADELASAMGPSGSVTGGPGDDVTRPARGGRHEA